MKSEIERQVSSSEQQQFAEHHSQPCDDNRTAKVSIFTYTPRKSKALIISVAILYAVILQSVLSHDPDSSAEPQLASKVGSAIAQTVAEELPSQEKSLEQELGFGGPINDYEQALQVDQAPQSDEQPNVTVLDPVASEEKLVPTGGSEPVVLLSSDLESLANSPVVLTKSVVNVGDTLTRVFRRNNLADKHAFALLNTPGAKAISVLYPNDQFKFVWSDNKLLGIELRRKKKVALMAMYDGTRFSVVDKRKAQQAGSLVKLLKREIESVKQDNLADYDARYAEINRGNLTWSNVTVSKGDNLTSIFRRIGLDSQAAIQIAAVPGNNWLVTNLQPGQELNIAVTDDDRFAILESPDYTSARVRLTFPFQDDYFVGFKKLKTELQEHYACAKVESNLYQAGQKVNIPRTAINKFVNLFDSRIDFSRQLRGGDRICIIYEQEYVQGKPVLDIRIKAASLTQKDFELKAFRHVDDDGQTAYFDSNGLSMRGHFLRSPIKYARVTSIYSKSRYHPVLKKNRPHLGVDYGAKTGTAIRATATGRVVKRAHYKGYGKTIALQHGSRYRTIYAHMSRFADGTGIGNFVKQGQVIGYVGSTGLSTGPHLHYEFHVDGKHRDPLNYDMPKGEPIADEYQHKFQAFVDEFSQRLASITAPQIGYSASTVQTASSN